MEELKQSPAMVKSTQTKEDDDFEGCRKCSHCRGEDEDMHCRRYPPTIIVDTTNGETDVKFPGVRPEWICGEFI